MGDILFDLDGYTFSYRVAGILLRDEKILLQKPADDPGFAVPGGHVALGETNEQTLIREFKEEIGADISAGPLKWVAENFFTWRNKPCHQICLYYGVSLKDEAQIPLSGVFTGGEIAEGRDFQIEFHWVPIDSLGEIEVYPANIAELMKRYNEGVQHFVYTGN
ncbi:MAG: NUDIX hydrolase [Defluviitaleaceae bacterium]|nr:NUDIX hydrolase [Defluviitaleaceae bacterium]